jgi:hypothetical protein
MLDRPSPEDQTEQVPSTHKHDGGVEPPTRTMTLEQTTRRYGRVCDYVGLRISERRREIDSPNGFALWTPQKSPFAANHEDFHRRAAAGWTRHGNQLGTVQPRIHGSQKNDLLGQGATEQVVVHTYGGVERDAPASIGAPARRDDVAPAVPAC